MPTPERCFLCGYADDTTLVAQSMNCNMAIKYASKGANVLKAFFDTWQLQVNCSKTQTMLVTKKGQRKLITLSSKEPPAISRVNTMKLLGVTFDPLLNFLAEMRARRSAAYRAFAALFCLAGRYSKLHREKTPALQNCFQAYPNLWLSPLGSGSPKRILGII